ncbi:sulfite exporter TauE/SafE family protein [Methylocella sp.]|uniref:sulfite exporter TauE/SafE family protein n=1 Tax=Methylocella sp. TaxID=1978226 RepID=UPI0035AF17AD
MFALFVVALAAFAAGVINALAGGGSFLTLPAMIAAGAPPIAANASSTLALFPGQVATAYAARDGLAEAARDPRIDARILGVISLVGGFVGGLLLLFTPASVFAALVPWLILFATLLFAGGSMLRPDSKLLRINRSGVFAAQAMVAVYGGYFGGGIGILMLAALTLYGLRDIWLMNSLKIFLATLMNASAVAALAFTDLIHWRLTLIAAVAAVLGGYVGVHAARRLPTKVVRGFVVVMGAVLTVYFFMKAP